MSTRLLDEMRDLMRRRHDSIHTERAYRDWVKRYVRFHDMQSRDDLRHGEEKIEAFLTHLARDRQVAASTQNQAMNALVFLYRHVLEQPLSGEINADRARRKVRIPVVLTREETARVIARLAGVHQLIVKLLYGSGLRITECLRLRFQDVVLEMKAIARVVRQTGIGKRVSTHTFRHSFATHLLQRGTDIRTIQALLGHNDVSTTMIYTHVLHQGGHGVTSPLDDLAIGC